MSATDSDIESYKSTLTEDHYLGARATQIHTRARGAPTCTLARRRRPVARRARSGLRAPPDAGARARACARAAQHASRGTRPHYVSHTHFTLYTLYSPLLAPSFRPLPFHIPVYLTSQYAINTVRQTCSGI